jgi:hypothetical protein
MDKSQIFQNFTKYKLTIGLVVGSGVILYLLYFLINSVMPNNTSPLASKDKYVDSVSLPKPKVKLNVDENSNEDRIIASYVQQVSELKTALNESKKENEANKNKIDALEETRKKDTELMTSKIETIMAEIANNSKGNTQQQITGKTPLPPPTPISNQGNTSTGNSDSQGELRSQQSSCATCGNNQQNNIPPPQGFGMSQYIRPNVPDNKKPDASVQPPQPEPNSHPQNNGKGMKIYRYRNTAKKDSSSPQLLSGIEQKTSAYGNSVKIADKDRLFSGTVSTAVVEPLLDPQEGTVNLADAVIPARILQGIDAPTFEKTQTNPPYVLMESIDMAFLPNDERFSFDKCFILGIGYGDLSSERAHIKLDNMRCIKGDKSVFISLKGYIAGIDGKEGVRGRVVSRQGAMMFNAMVAGFFSGFSKSLSSSAQTLSLSPLGATQTIDPQKALQSGAYTGVGSAFDKLADYYIKLVDMMHPIIEIDANLEVTAIVTQPAYMLPI